MRGFGTLIVWLSAAMWMLASCSINCGRPCSQRRARYMRERIAGMQRVRREAAPCGGTVQAGPCRRRGVSDGRASARALGGLHSSTHLGELKHARRQFLVADEQPGTSERARTRAQEGDGQSSTAATRQQGHLATKSTGPRRQRRAASAEPGGGGVACTALEPQHTRLDASLTHYPPRLAPARRHRQAAHGTGPQRASRPRTVVNRIAH